MELHLSSEWKVNVIFMRKQKVSRAVIRRLPRYYRHLSDLHNVGIERISSNALGKAMGITASQIRQDLSCFGEFGQQGYGYNIEKLLSEVCDILGMNENHSVIILGVGNLGRALMENFRFKQNGFTLLAAFDVSTDLVGTTIGGTPIYHEDHLEEFIHNHNVTVAVLTVPSQVAQTMSNRLAQTNIKGVWNFTNVELSIPNPSIVVEDVHFAESLLALSYMITEDL